ncbi:pro-opiomelanocortin [Rhinophrynus dorsalis]
MDLSAESPIFPGNGHMQPLSENTREYVMSHFRWNKFGKTNNTVSDGSNTGYKREDLSIYPILNQFPNKNPNPQDSNLEREDLERQENKRSYSMNHFRWGKPVGRKRRPIKVYPNDVEEESSESEAMEFRRELPEEPDYPEFDSDEDVEDNESLTIPMKKNGNYRMHHFRWGSPPKDKRYGGFMTPERSQTNLMTLFKNAIIKNTHKKDELFLLEMLWPVRSCVLAILGSFLLHIGEIQCQCWESSRCGDLSSEDDILECIRTCKTGLTAESPLFPGNGHLQPLSENIRKYVMSHFRWNKFGRRNSTGNDGINAGYKREDLSYYPIFDMLPANENQNLQSSSIMDEALDRQDDKRSYSMEHFRWGKPAGRKRRPIKVYPSEMEEESTESYPTELRRELSLDLDYPELNSDANVEDNESLNIPMKKNGKYRMHHFRWGSPSKDKRYGGFMTPERSQTPLMTLFKNAMIKNIHKKGQ